MPSTPSRRVALGAGAVLGAGALLEAAGCSTTGSADPTSSPATTGSAATSPTATSAPTTGTTSSPVPTGDARPRAASVQGPDIVHGPRDREEVALTFHGQGPASLTDAIRAACRDAGAAVTVFAVGTWVHAAPALARGLAADGHELGNHTWSHQQMPALSPAVAHTEVRRGRDALAAALGSAGWWFRPSGTPHSTATIRSAARAAGYARCVSYDVDPQDYLDPGAAAVRRRVRREVRAGSIVSLHLGHPGTAEAMPAILSDLAAAGLRPVTVSHLLRD